MRTIALRVRICPWHLWMPLKRIFSRLLRLHAQSPKAEGDHEFGKLINYGDASASSRPRKRKAHMR
jgi:hypothetical protein